MIVSLHGIDASGKATQAAALTKALVEEARLEASTFDFPHYQSTMGTIIGQILRGELLVVPKQEALEAARGYSAAAKRPSSNDPECGTDENPLDYIDELQRSWTLDKGYAIQALMLVNRLEFFDMLREHADQYTEKVLVLDRYVIDAYAFGQADGLPLEWLERVHSVLPAPDVAIFLDIPVEVSVERRPNRRDYYEKNLEKLGRVRDLYRAYFMRGQEKAPKTFHILDGTQTADAITNQIYSLVLRSMQDQP